MGLLDDAIREHLELKRRRGADPAEIERSEREALGPVRRAPEDLEPADFDPHAEAEDGQEYEYENGNELEASYAEESHETELFEPEPPADHEPLPEEVPQAQAPPAGETPPPHPAPGSGHLSQETVEYELEDHPEAGEHHEGEDPEEGEPDEGESAEGEDVLEETPEFLQDTPEHDRLWFEQRPPRDFDFDG